MKSSSMTLNYSDFRISPCITNINLLRIIRTHLQTRYLHFYVIKYNTAVIVSLTTFYNPTHTNNPKSMTPIYHSSHIKNFNGTLSIRNADKPCVARQLYGWLRPGICNAIGSHEEFSPASGYILDDVRATKLVVALAVSCLKWAPWGTVCLVNTLISCSSFL